MYKIAVVGDKDSILGFKALGISVFPVSESDDAAAILKELERDNYAVIYITEQVADKITAVIDEYKDKRIPAIIPVPGNQGVLGIGMLGVKKSVERAVGADILFRDE